MITAVALGILTSLIAGEITSVSPWCAKKLARWAALRRYADNPERAEIRAEELAALVEIRPGNLLKLMTALGFAAVGLTRSLFKAGRRGSGNISREAPRPLVLPQVTPQAATPNPSRLANDSFSAFYQHTYPRLVRYLASLGKGGLSEDAAQAAMIMACEKWDSLRTLDRPDTWVFTVAKRELMRRERQVRKEASLWSGYIVAAEETSDLIEMHIDVASALDRLPSRRAEITRLYVLQGYTIADIAATLNIPLVTVRRELHDGLSYLREQLSSWHEPKRTNS
jgi:RNA polymerase sigma factor (sigma-70 family)